MNSLLNSFFAPIRRHWRGLSPATCVLIVACGGDLREQTAQLTNFSTNVTAAPEVAVHRNQAKLPDAAIVRVPVDAQGQQIGEAAELRVVDQSDAADFADAAGAASAFAAAKVPMIAAEESRDDFVVNELDRDRSTESFWGWHRRHYSCRIGCGLDYRPVIYVGGTSYTYSTPVYFYSPMYSWQVISTPVYTTTVVGYTYYYYLR